MSEVSVNRASGEGAAVRAPEPGRVRRSVITWMTGIAGSGIIALAGFVATPLLVRWLGDTQWGAWTVVSEWLGYLGLTQLVFGPGAITIFLLRAHTQSGPDTLAATAKRGIYLYTKAALAVVPLALVLAWWAPRGLHTGAGLSTAVRVAIALAGVGGLALAGTVVLRSLLETVQRGYLVRLALLAQSLSITGLSLWWVWAGGGIVAMAAASLAGMSLGAGLWWFWARPWLAGWRHRPAAHIPTGEIWRYSWPMVVALAGNQINLLTDNTVVGLRMGAAAVAGFALTQTILLLAGSQVTEIGAASWAALGEMRARRDPSFAARIIELGGTITGTGIVILATLAAFNRSFVSLWVGAAHYDGGWLTWLTAAAMAVCAMLSFFGWLIDTQGDTRRRLGASSIGAVLNLGLSLWLISRWGVAGVAAGTLIAFLCTDAWYLPYLVTKLYGVPGSELLRSLLGAAARGSVWALGMALLAWKLPPPASWATLLLEAGVTGTAAMAYIWRWALRDGDRAAWRARIAAVFSPGAPA